LDDCHCQISGVFIADAVVRFLVLKKTKKTKKAFFNYINNLYRLFLSSWSDIALTPVVARPPPAISSAFGSKDVI
tara:strand:+ start:2356 stop:2580 length:225 start_codon:yes stop_codon:yes gene_type:complete